MKARLTIASIALFAIGGCNTTTAPSQIPIQFKAVNAAAADPITITTDGASIRVAGGYRGAGCGSIGAFAELNGSTIELTVGPLRSGDIACDASLVYFSYEASMLVMRPAEYEVEVFHRKNPSDNRELAGTATLEVR